jgi:restriction endonuclease S subunit
VRAGWTLKRLGDVLVKTSTADPTKEPNKHFTYIDVSSVSNLSFSIVETSEVLGKDAPSRARRHVRTGDVIFATIRPTLLRVAIVPEALNNAVCSTGYFVMRAGPKLDNRFLFYWLFSSDFQAEMEARQKGASYPAVNDSDIRDQQIPLPPLDEQRRIVAVLDKAFAAIATATANAQKNQSNARALFESYLRSVFDAPSAGWQRSTLGKLTSKIGSGATPRGGKDAYKADGTPLIRSMNVHDRYFKDRNLAFIDDQQARLLNNVIVQENDVLLNITGASVARCCLASQALANARVNQHVAIIRPHSDQLQPQFLELALTSPYYKDILLGVGEKGGSTRQAITKAEIQSLEIAFPSIDEQNIVIEHASKLQIETRKLSVIADQKLTALAELKQSLLQKAFAGELTAAVAEAPAANDNFATPQFTAQILAFAHRRHEQKQKQRTFGHVKAQKSLHLVESIGGIDLGRQPIKDAAGPNDMQHMLRATDWAVQQGFFEFVPRANGKGYDFKKLANYDACWAEAQTAINPVAADVARAIDLIVDSPSDFAELIATTHAAWNNLIIDKAAITDDAIVLEARDNWHVSKLKHEPSRFHDAIRFIRSNGIVPDGSAKYVGGQVSLL